MKYDNTIQKIIKENDGIITVKEWTKHNIPRIYLTRMVKDGDIEKVARGIYVTKDGYYDDYFLFQQQFSKCIYSFQSALYFHNLTDRVPFRKEVTLYKGYNPHTLPFDVTVHYVNKSIYELGITTVKTPFGNTTKVYDMERTVCDLVKNRKDIDVEIFKKAIKGYLESKDKKINTLYKYATKMKIETQINSIMEVMYE